jgi:hypothetical protein
MFRVVAEVCRWQGRCVRVVSVEPAVSSGRLVQSRLELQFIVFPFYAPALANRSK